MIHYQLRCSQQHEFDGWFQSSTAFEKQATGGFVECPVCGDVKVGRALMAPAISTREAEAPVPAQRAPEAQPSPPASVPVPAPTAAVSGPMPAHIRAMLQRMRAEVEKHCDYVGPAFADEARKMHRGETEHRGIYGETTPGEAEALADEGIEVSRMPWVPRADG
ncbi:MAG TPA: DUF1178 family protein [Acetobacteraceae bacterium]|nr:DUF1178 family protein [Acetobacteraceae bacterium]